MHVLVEVIMFGTHVFFQVLQQTQLYPIISIKIVWLVCSLHGGGIKSKELFSNSF